MSQQLTAGALINRHFFFIDSTDETLNDVRTHLYGYFIDGGKVFDGKLDEDFSFDENKFYSGSYIFVRKSTDRIELIQDYVGSYGLFLFRHGDYFALSNSFVMLVDRLKTKFPLTFNEDYARATLVFDAIQYLSLGGTLIKEIEMLPRDVRLIIDTNRKLLTQIPVRYAEHSVPLDSAEAIELIDNWARKWIKTINNLVDGNEIVQTDLTGGFDSRITFMLLISSGIDLNKILINSRDNMYAVENSKRVAQEDFAITSEITKFYSCSLNIPRGNPPKRPLTVEEIISIYFYTKLGLHEIMFGSDNYYLRPIYYFNGYGGENLRDYIPSAEAFIRGKQYFGREYKTVDLSESVTRILTLSLDRIAKSQNFIESKMPLNGTPLYREVGARNHFGKIIIEKYLSNKLSMTPLLDWEISRIRAFPSISSDPLLLFTFLLVRFQKELLNFKVQGGRSFKPETIKLAEEINAKYPLDPTLIRPRKISADAVIQQNRHSAMPADSPMRKAKERLVQMSRTPEFKSTFTEHFSDEIYFKAQQKADAETDIITTRLHRLNPVIAATKFLMDARLSQYVSGSFDQYLNAVDDSAHRSKVRSRKLSLLLDLFRTARIELIKDNAPDAADFVVESSDPSCVVYNVFGLGNNRSGRMLESSVGSLNIKVRCQAEGAITMLLKGAQNDKLPLKIDFTSVSINRQNALDKRRTVSFDKPHVVGFQVPRNSVIEIVLRWEVYGYDESEFKRLIETALDEGAIY